MNRTMFIVCVICLIRNEDKILIMKRSLDKCEDPGCWEMVAGKLESGEKPDQAVLREITEETGLKVATCKNPFYIFDWKITFFGKNDLSNFINLFQYFSS